MHKSTTIVRVSASERTFRAQY